MTWIVILLALFLGFALFYIFRLRQRLAVIQREEIKKMEARRGSFISIISHQLRTPLSIIKGYLESLATGDLGALNTGQQEYVTEAAAINKETIDLVNDYLATVKLDSETMDVHPEPLDLVAMVSQEVDRLQSLARASNCTITFNRPAAQLPQVRADVVKIRQVIENILTNAIKYTRRSGRVTLTMSNDPRGVVLRCQDTGVGIPDNQQAEIFTKFFRAQNVLNKNTKGSGLGLYLAKMIVTALGGDIWLESKENEGTTVYVRLPRANA